VDRGGLIGKVDEVEFRDDDGKVGAVVYGGCPISPFQNGGHQAGGIVGFDHDDILGVLFNTKIQNEKQR